MVGLNSVGDKSATDGIASSAFLGSVFRPAAACNSEVNCSLEEPRFRSHFPYHLLRSLGCLATVCASISFACVAQSPGVQTPNTQDNSGVQPFQSYLHDNETINPATGALNLNIPILHLPGRAGHDLDLAISYNNQAILSLGVGAHPVTDPNTYQPINAITQFVMGWNTSSSYGWSSSLPSLSFLTMSRSMPPDDPQYGSACFGAPNLNDTHGRQMSFGEALFGCAGELRNNTLNYGAQFTTAADDQGNHAIIDLGAVAGPTIFFPNGERLVTPAAPPGQNLMELNPTTFFDVDRNGNTITYLSNSGSSPTQTTITDTIGRQINVTQNRSLITGVSYLNSNGQTQSMTFIYGGSPLMQTGNIDQPTLQFGDSPTWGTVDANSGSGSSAIQYVGVNGSSSSNINLSQMPLSAIILPNGQTYTFQYDAYGDLVKVTYPDGGYTRYDYQKLLHATAMTIASAPETFQLEVMQVTAKHVCTAAATPLNSIVASVGNTCPIAEENTTYTPSAATMVDNWSTGNTSNTMVTPDGTSTTYTYPSITPTATQMFDGVYQSKYAVTAELSEVTTSSNGMFLHSVTNQYAVDQAHLLSKVTTLDNGNTITEQWSYLQTPIVGINTTSYPLPGATNGSILCSGYCGYTGTAANQYASYAEIWNVSSYSVRDWNGIVLKTTGNTWQMSNFDPSRPFLPSQKLTETIYQGSSFTPLASMQYVYDNYSVYPLLVSGAAQHAVNGMSFTTSDFNRGNLTGILKWRNTDNLWIPSYIQYDDAGSKVRDVDANGNSTTYSYSDSWSNSACAPYGPGSDAYPTSITNVYGQSTHNTYNSCTGTIAVSTDINLRSTSYTYDAYDRVVDVLSPDVYPGTTIHGETTTCYSDSGACPGATESANYVLVSTLETPSIRKVSETDTDGMGRKKSQKVLSDPYGMMEVDTSYDNMGRVASVTNPYRPNSGQGAHATTHLYDGLGRPVVTYLPDGTSNSTSYAGMTTQSYDETGRSWTHVHDALNRLSEVLEADSSGRQSVATQYSYDSLGNLLQVDQWGGSVGASGDRVRTFTYNSLSQLVTSYNPEAGTICYGIGNGNACSAGYDLNGKLLRQTDARGITTAYTVDSLNRIVSRTYSDGTPSACYQFDNSLSDNTGGNLVGKLLYEWTQPGNCAGSTVPPSALNYRIVNSYDAKGKILNETQCPSAPCATPFTFPYSYDLAGNTISWSQGLPTSPTLASTFDSAGRLSAVTSSLSDAADPGLLFRADTSTASTSGIPYGPFGLMTSERGISPATNVAGIVSVNDYDLRGRLKSENDLNPMSVLTPATSSNGQITLNFAEQQVSGGGTPSTGSFTISGADQPGHPLPSNTALAPGCLDFGVVILVVVDPYQNQVQQYDVEYENGMSQSTVAANLAALINSQSTFVHASVSGNVVSLTSIAVGPYVNYILAYSVVSITTENTSSTVVSGPSFTVTASVQTMTGGSGSGSGGSGTIFDSGTLTATIGNITATTNWGQNDTAATIASNLASALQSASYNVFTVNASNNVINLQSVATGAAQNVQISLSASHNTQYFTSGIPVTWSDFGMSGASNAVPASLYSFSAGYLPNGDLSSVVDSVMGNWNYGYDQLNRITTATSSSGPFSGTSLGWNYDAWGNRMSQNVSQPSGNQTTILPWWATYNARNQVTANSLAMNGYGYADGENVSSDGQNVYAYDGDGRLCAVQNLVGSITGYTYDAEGIRVSRGTQTSMSCTGNNGFATTAKFLVDLGGAQVTEIDGANNWKHSNVFAQGRLIATYDAKGTHFHFTDIIGTRRVQVSGTGVLEETCTSLPFGDQLNCIATAASTADDATEQHFTGKERDTESGLDYFGARYYSSIAGRFLSPDWSSSTVPVPYADFNNPQSLNLFAYVQNNPATHNDLTGHASWFGSNVGCASIECHELYGNGAGSPYASPCNGCGMEEAYNRYVDGINAQNQAASVRAYIQTMNAAAQQPSSSTTSNSTPPSDPIATALSTVPGVASVTPAPDPTLDVAIGGHQNETNALTFKTPADQAAFLKHSSRKHLVSGDVSENGYGPGVRLPGGLHAENGRMVNGQFLVTAHIDRFNANNGLAPLVGHFIVDVMIGMTFYHHSAGLDH